MYYNVGSPGSSLKLQWHIVMRPPGISRSHYKGTTWTVADIGLAHMAYFFFDTKDSGKRDVCGLLSSLIIQLSHQSDSLSDILFHYYSTHQYGSRQPMDSTLAQ